VTFCRPIWSYLLGCSSNSNSSYFLFSSKDDKGCTKLPLLTFHFQWKAKISTVAKAWETPESSSGQASSTEFN